MLRVWDTKKKKWCDPDGFYLSCYEDLYTYSEKRFGSKLKRVRDDERYVYHRSLGMHDETGTEVYEGDILGGVKDDGQVCYMTVAYVPSHAQFVLFDEDDKPENMDGTYYLIEDDFIEELKIVGNVFEGIKEEIEAPEIVEEPEEVVADDVNSIESDGIEVVEAEVIEENELKE